MNLMHTINSLDKNKNEMQSGVRRECGVWQRGPRDMFGVCVTCGKRGFETFRHELHAPHTSSNSWCGFHATRSRQSFREIFNLVLTSQLGIQFRLRNIDLDSNINMENYITFNFKLEVESRFPIKTRNVPNVSEIIRNI